jgi:hypothetical protein
MILFGNLRIANEIRKDCEFSIAMESEESENVSAKGDQKTSKYNEKFEGSFCIYQNPARNRRSKWRGRRVRRHQKKQDHEAYDAKSTKISNKKTILINNKDIFENDDCEDGKVTFVKPRRSRYMKRRKHEIRGIRISFGPKTHSQESISTQTSESPNRSRDSGFGSKDLPNTLETSLERKAQDDSSLEVPVKSDALKKVYTDPSKNKMFGSSEKDLKENIRKLVPEFKVEDEGDNVSLSSDSFADLEEFQLEIDQEFKENERSGFSFYKTPTKRLDEQFMKVCLSDKKNMSQW